jgi:hypothetical protein
MEAGKPDEAGRLYLEWISRLGDCAILSDRMARVEREMNEVGKAASWLAREEAQGWVTEGLRERIR